MATGTSDLLLNEALVFDVLFGRDSAGTLVAPSLLCLLGAYGPTVAGLLARLAGAGGRGRLSQGSGTRRAVFEGGWADGDRVTVR